MKGFMQGLSNSQRTFMMACPPCQVFAVITWGCAASSWIAKVLNSHPDIYCVHANNIFWNVLGKYERLDGLEYLRIIACQGHSYLAAGDVHGVARHYVPELREILNKRFNAVVVVRDPLPRLHSQLSLFKQVKGSKAWDVSYLNGCNGLVKRNNVELPNNDYDNKLFVHAANMLNAIIEEQDVGNIYRSEDLNCNVGILGEFISEIIREKVCPDRKWLENTMKIEKVNVHVHQQKDTVLADWQIQVIQKVVRKEAWSLYTKLGYELPPFVQL